MNSKIYKIGTRGSLLALTQCNQIKDELEKKSNAKFELVVIKTEGDLNQSAPLWQIDGKDFFTKELDTALLSGEIDLVVHSCKDLATIRPSELKIGAITKREFTNDVLLIKKEVASKITSGKINKIIVGTSSPRRIQNINNYLPEFLNIDQIETKFLRGNVNTRISKLQNGEYDAIVLALAGIERLANSYESNLTLKKLLEGLTFFVLPLSSFPAAAAQGALAIEYAINRANSNELEEILKSVDDRNTRLEVEKERKAFSSYGGGCHLAVGVSVKKIGDQFLSIHQGIHDGNIVNKISIDKLPEFPPMIKESEIFLGMPINKKKNEQFIYDEYISKVELSDLKFITSKDNENRSYYVTSTYCINGLKRVFNNDNLIFSAGSTTAKKLFKAGFWVNGTADSLGENEIEKIIHSKALSLMMNSDNRREICVLTNNLAKSTLGQTIACYTRNFNEVDENYNKKISSAKIFFWTSLYQYEQFNKKFTIKKDAIHCCGLGKTYEELMKYKLNVFAFSSVDEFIQWTKKYNTKE